MENRQRATAVVSVTISIPLSQPWGETSTIEEIQKTASREAVDTVRKVFGNVNVHIYEPVVVGINISIERVK